MATALNTVHVPLHQPLRDAPYDQHMFLDQLTAAMGNMRFHQHARQHIPRTFEALGYALENCQGLTLQERWQDFEQRIWPQWRAGQDRPAGKWWTGGVRVAVTARLVRPSWDLLCTSNTATWMKYLPADDPLAHQSIFCKRRSPLSPGPAQRCGRRHSMLACGSCSYTVMTG